MRPDQVFSGTKKCKHSLIFLGCIYTGYRVFGKISAKMDVFDGFPQVLAINHDLLFLGNRPIYKGFVCDAQ